MKLERAKEPADLPLAERHINMSNALARSAHGLTLAEKRVVALGLAKTDSVPARELFAAARQGWTVRVTAEEYAQQWGVTLNTAYSQLKEAADHLIRRQVRTLQSTRRGLKEIRTNWCGQCIYHHGEGWAEIAFTPQISPHLLGLRVKFMSYKLRQATALRSVYSWRLFECLQSWRDTGLWRVGIEEFMHAMDAPESCRIDFADLRRRVIEPAVAELVRKNGLRIDWLSRKAGRKVVGLEFRFGADSGAGG